MVDFIISLIQNKPVVDIRQSLKYLAVQSASARGRGADLIMFTESCYHPYELPAVRSLAKQSGWVLDALRDIARKNKVYLCAGSIFVPSEVGIYNRAHIIDPQGEIVLTHDKCHLYDVNFQGLRIRESRFVQAGTRFKSVQTPLGRIGMLICYDIRFPEAMRSLGDVEIVLVPAAFNQVSGPAHWEVLFRARAIENQCFIAACSPARDKSAAYVAYGHSMVVDPWGRILGEAGEGEEVVTVSLQRSIFEDVRGKLPLIEHRRTDIYTY